MQSLIERNNSTQTLNELHDLRTDSEEPLSSAALS